MCHDMHDCSIATGNLWMRRHLDSYAQWAKTHNSLLRMLEDMYGLVRLGHAAQAPAITGIWN